MGTFTRVDPAELHEFVRGFGIDKIEEIRGVERGSVNTNLALRSGSERWFLRVYEEQDHAGAGREIDLVVWLAANGIPTPAALARPDGTRLGTLAGKPAALLPFASGEMSCQRGLGRGRMVAVGDVLARLHSLRPPVLWPTRFGPAALAQRLERIAVDARYGALAAPLRRALDLAVAQRDAVAVTTDVGEPSALRGLVHGDVFRDNVLWDGDRLTALLDFESASEGPFAYDVAVTLLAFCFDDDFVPALVAGFFAGYERRRPLSAAEKRAIFHEARLAALRFTITRLTDYAMRAGAELAQKDYRRFEARLARLDALGERGFAALAEGP